MLGIFADIESYFSSLAPVWSKKCCFLHSTFSIKSCWSMETNDVLGMKLEKHWCNCWQFLFSFFG